MDGLCGGRMKGAPHPSMRTLILTAPRAKGRGGGQSPGLEGTSRQCIPNGPRRCGGCRVSKTKGQKHKHTGQCHRLVQHRHKNSLDKESVRENAWHTHGRALQVGGKFPLSTAEWVSPVGRASPEEAEQKGGRPEYKRPRATPRALKKG